MRRNWVALDTRDTRCGPGLDDPDSLARGIGSDCWQAILTHLTVAASVTGEGSA